MKKIFTALAALVVAGLFAACQKDDLGVEPTGIDMPTSLTLEVAETYRLSPNILPQNATLSSDFVWSSSAPQIADVDSEGKVTSHARGTAVITAQLKAKPSVAATCNVTVDEQSVVFEDEALLAIMMYFDADNDGKLQLSELENIRELNVAGNGIESMKGIEYCIGLEILHCEENSLSALDVSQNLQLKELYCYRNSIEQLDVSMLPQLEVLHCHSNRLAAIDVANNAELRDLDCSLNNGGMSAHYGIRSVDVTQNPKLESLNVNYLHISELDVTRNPQLKRLDMGLSCYTMEHMFTPIEQIDLSNNPELEWLNAQGCNEPGMALRSLDLSHNPKLKHLVVVNNLRLEALDLSRNTELTYLNCRRVPLRELNVTMCPDLVTLDCGQNKLIALDLTASVALETLLCDRNEIGELDLSNTRMMRLEAQNNKISRIEMGDKTFDTKHPIGAGSSPGSMSGKPYLYMKLNDNLIEQIDLSRQTYLAWLEINDNRLTSLDVKGCFQLGGLHCAGNEIAALGLEGCNALYQLVCNDNRLAGTLDISHTGGDRVISKVAAENNNLDRIVIQDGFNPSSSGWVVDHTTGFSGSVPNYTKDPHTKWVTVSGREL